MRNVRCFTSSHNISIELRYRLWLGQSGKGNLFTWSHSLVVLLECFGFLSCCITHFRPVKNYLTGLRIHGSLDNRGRKAAAQSNPTMLHCWEEVFFLVLHLTEKNAKAFPNPKTSKWSPRLLGKYSVDWQDKSGTFWKVCVWHDKNACN